MAKRILLLLLSAASLAYYLWIGSNNAFSMSLLSVWPALSVLSLGLALLPKRVRLPRWLRWTLLVFLLPVLIAAGCILGGMTARGGEDLDCLVVLGAALNGREPSAALEARLETAADYLDAHPETDVIVSGGQGVSEVVSEAECMRDWLLRRGIDPGRIRMEDRSTDTAENLRYSLAMLPGEGLRVGHRHEQFPRVPLPRHRPGRGRGPADAPRAGSALFAAAAAPFPAAGAVRRGRGYPAGPNVLAFMHSFQKLKERLYFVG